MPTNKLQARTVLSKKEHAQKTAEAKAEGLTLGNYIRKALGLVPLKQGRPKYYDGLSEGLSTQQRYQRRHKNQGLCLECPQPAIAGLASCELHRRRLVRPERNK